MNKTLLSNLCPDDLEDLYQVINELLPTKRCSSHSNHEILARERGRVCPHCHSTHIVKNGHTQLGRQKYRCKNCSKCYSDTTNSVLCRNRKNYDLWAEFVKLELLGLTLRQEAEELDVSVTTAFSWRHRLYKSISKKMEAQKVSGTVQLDATYKSINLKGTRPFNMPRISKKRTASSLRGLSHHKVCILSAVDNADHMFFTIAGVGRESIDKYLRSKERLQDVEMIICDSFMGIEKLATELNCKLDLILSTQHVSATGNSLATTNGLHKELNDLIRRYHGVSIRHLQDYMNMFVFRKQLNYHFEYKRKLREAYIQSLPNYQTIKNNEICKTALPIDLCQAYGEYQYGSFSTPIST